MAPRRDTVTEQEALEDYRSRDTTPAAQRDDTAGSATLPAPGVYSYTASGQEVVKLGPLPAETRPYPDTMTVVIVDDEPSCFTATLNLLDQHTEDTTYCLDDTGRLLIDSHHKHQQIGAVNPSAAMTCDPDVLIAQAPTTATSAAHCCCRADPRSHRHARRLRTQHRTDHRHRRRPRGRRHRRRRDLPDHRRPHRNMA